MYRGVSNQSLQVRFLLVLHGLKQSEQQRDQTQRDRDAGGWSAVTQRRVTTGEIGADGHAHGKGGHHGQVLGYPTEVGRRAAEQRRRVCCWKRRIRGNEQIRNQEEDFSGGRSQYLTRNECGIPGFFFKYKVHLQFMTSVSRNGGRDCGVAMVSVLNFNSCSYRISWLPPSTRRKGFWLNKMQKVFLHFKPLNILSSSTLAKQTLTSRRGSADVLFTVCVVGVGPVNPARLVAKRRLNVRRYCRGKIFPPVKAGLLIHQLSVTELNVNQIQSDYYVLFVHQVLPGLTTAVRPTFVLLLMFLLSYRTLFILF